MIDESFYMEPGLPDAVYREAQREDEIAEHGIATPDHNTNHEEDYAVPRQV